MYKKGILKCIGLPEMLQYAILYMAVWSEILMIENGMVAFQRLCFDILTFMFVLEAI